MNPKNSANPYAAQGGEPPVRGPTRTLRRLSKAFAWLAFAGFVLLLAGLIYGTVAVGVPYQDAPPELLQRQEWHLALSTGLTTLGAMALVVGIAGRCVVSLCLAWQLHAEEKRDPAL